MNYSILIDAVFKLPRGFITLDLQGKIHHVNRCKSNSKEYMKLIRISSKINFKNS